jgi:hypothetical protein
MTGECVQRKQDDVGEQHEGTNADSETSIEPEGMNCVVPENDEKDKRQIKKIAMKILQNQRKCCFATIVMGFEFADGTGRWIKEKGAIVSLAILLTGGPKTQRPAENKNRWRKRPPGWLN